MTVALDRSGDRVKVSVRDLGPGMTLEVREAALEPFFTTKEGRGMGLGLYVARLVSERRRGRLDLESEPGRGTTATLTLPLEGREPAGAGATMGRILVVDDDAAFRDRLVRAFSDRGHAALGANSHTNALAAGRHAVPDRAVVDLRMPGKSGLDVVADLVALVPGIRVVVLTGYGSIATATEAIRLGAVDYLTKPADADQILAAFASPERLRGASPARLPEETPSLERVEWEHIQRVLADAGGNVTQAARALGIHRRSLQRKLARRPPAH